MSRNGRRIRILYTIPNFNTAGSGKALINVISRLDRNIFEPSICCRHERGELFKSAQDLNIQIYISYFTVPTKPRVQGAMNVVKLSNVFRKINPDIIHSYNYSDDYSEAIAAKLSGINWIYTKKNMGWGSNAWKARTRLADAIIPQNHEMMESFFSGLNKCYLIPIGIDTAEFSSIKRDENIVKEFGLEEASPVVVTIANIIPIKGIDFLIKGFSLVLEDFPNAKLLIIGDDRTIYADNLKRYVRERGYGNNIIFTGRQSNIKRFFGIADIFMLSSMKAGEGGPISVLEAMASGVLSYGSDVAGIRDQFREFQDQLFESENPGSIANKILFTMRMKPEEKKERESKQKVFITRYYSIENEVKQLQDLYMKIANRN